MCRMQEDKVDNEKSGDAMLNKTRDDKKRLTKKIMMSPSTRKLTDKAKQEPLPVPRWMRIDE